MNCIGPAEGGFFDNNTQKWYFGRVPFLGLIGGMSSAPSTHSPKHGKDIKDRKNIFYGGFLGIDLLHPQERENLL
jgi:hypothetical protein